MQRRRWQISTWSSGGECVEARRDGAVIRVRDSTDRSGPVLTFGLPAWRRAVRALRRQVAQV